MAIRQTVIQTSIINALTKVTKFRIKDQRTKAHIYKEDSSITKWSVGEIISKITVRRGMLSVQRKMLAVLKGCLDHQKINKSELQGNIQIKPRLRINRSI